VKYEDGYTNENGVDCGAIRGILGRFRVVPAVEQVPVGRMADTERRCGLDGCTEGCRESNVVQPNCGTD
jgi:hypothetical protein